LKPVASRAIAPIPLKPVRPTGEVYEIDPIREPRWAALVDSHPRSSVFHSPNWLRALHEVYGYNPVVVTTCPPDAALTNGLVFCQIKSWLTGRRLVSLPFSDHCEPLTDPSTDIDEMVSHIRQRVDIDKWKYIEIRPVLYQPGSATQLRRSVSYVFHRLDLRPGTDELMRRFHKNCVQRKIRRAERERLTYEAGASEDLLQKFYRLQVMTRRRQYLPPQPLNWFRGLSAAFGKDFRIRLASKDGTAVAAILTLAHKKTMVYKYGCSDAEYSRFGGTALLFWNTIQEARSSGFEKLDMGRSAIDNLGLIAFKEHWGATGTSISYWTYPQSHEELLNIWTKKVARRVISAVPDGTLKAAGKLLYKHIG